MLLQVNWSEDGQTLIIKNDRDGMAYITDDWPRQVRPEDLLHALFGQPGASGRYPYHEKDHRWLFTCLETVQGFDSGHLAILAIQDWGGVQQDLDTSPSRIAAGSLATLLLQRAFEVPREHAARLVRMNLGVTQAAA